MYLMPDADLQWMSDPIDIYMKVYESFGASSHAQEKQNHQIYSLFGWILRRAAPTSKVLRRKREGGVRRDSVCLADRAENFFIINFLPLPFPRKLFSPFSSLQFNGGRRNTEISGAGPSLPSLI